VEKLQLINTSSGVMRERKLYTSSFRELFVAADSIIYDRLDKFIRLFKTASLEFFTLYSNARNIIVNTAAKKEKKIQRNKKGAKARRQTLCT
jgi:NADPH-dependent 7-cyano-7-deazaguanine reductase QueF